MTTAMMMGRLKGELKSSSSNRCSRSAWAATLCLGRWLGHELRGGGGTSVTTRQNFAEIDKFLKPFRQIFEPSP